MERKLRVESVLFTVAMGCSAVLSPAADIGTAFTYQGYLEKPSGTPLTDTCNFAFRLWDDPGGGTQKGNSPQTAEGVLVSKGVFTVGPPDVDFGPGAFDGTARWLAIEVQCTGDVSYVQLSPRLELTPAPYALRAVEATALDLPYAPTESTSAPMLELTQTGDGPAATFKVQPQPEPPMPSPAIKATNVGVGSGLEVTSGTLSVSSAPTISAANIGVGTAIYASSTTGTAIHAVSNNDDAGYFEGSVTVTGDIKKAYTIGTSNRAVPVAYASINSDGTVATGTPNVSSSWDSANQRYLITIAGENYAATTHVTTVTPVVIASPEALFVTTGSGSGQLRIRIMSSSTGTTGLQRPFQFITYRP